MGHGTRKTPAKKQPKFKSKSYNLVPQQWISPGSSEPCGVSTDAVPFPDQPSQTVASSSMTKPFAAVAATHGRTMALKHTSGISHVATTKSSTSPHIVISGNEQNLVSSFHEGINYETTGTISAHGGRQASVHSLQTTPFPQESTLVSDISQQISIPVVMGSDGQQYAQLANDSYYVITDSSKDADAADTSTTNPIKHDELDLGMENNEEFGNASPTLMEGYSQQMVTSELQKIQTQLNELDGKFKSVATNDLKNTYINFVTDGT
ncbi:uncharacterized protein LOC129718769 [Wyeomyia smithii]|uniref:uncharacterized protein LOC129718769 n=1 Tax=Wyeomyia smithii TaxID=174621 RepID=UPI002467ED3D|nr:uncharacterized protein LOC129718769 [Wyeomyia smithii]